MEYPKIQTAWHRDPDTKFRTLIERAWATPEFAYLSDVPWQWTEKVDGTNIRVWLNERRFGGRTDNASIPAFLIDRLNELFPDPVDEYGDMVLYGEGFGAKIQKGGGNYNPDGVGFVLFDAFCGGLWLQREDVVDIAHKLGIEVVPEAGVGTLTEAVELTRQGFASAWGDFPAEGLVMRPLVELSCRRGRRIISKIKCKDFA